MDILLQYDMFAFLFALTVLVFFHELGHYAVARRCGVGIETFSIGFGPELFGWNDKHGTRWKFSLIPLGGYVKMVGDTNPASVKTGEAPELTTAQQNKAFFGKSLSQRTAIVAAGPMANFILALVLMAGLYVTIGQPYAPPIISEVMPQSAAERGGLQVGDTIISIEGTEIKSFDQLQRLIRVRPAEPLEFVIERGGMRQTQVISPDLKETTDTFGKVHRTGLLGVRSGTFETRKLGIVEAVPEAISRTWLMTGDILNGLWEIVSGARSFKEVGGPIQIYQVSHKVAEYGLASFITFLALLSVNLGLINLLPVPGLDGGHLVFYGAEWARGKPLSERVQEWFGMAGIGLILLLMVFATSNDVARLCETQPEDASILDCGVSVVGGLFGKLI
ncbi:MAG: RIP metalloprotease RseP [Alphaproteobacteria bacterium]|jgi:regulator of sigma E protease|nr:RIP metalloprotease RseP [Alphaproteobacteria bacterium]